MDAATKRGPIIATAAGAGVGTLGGLLGLGGAEFRLPLLVAVFRYPLRRAVPLNLAVSFVAVVVAAVVRWGIAKQAPGSGTALLIVCMMAGGMLGAALGARWLASVSDERLYAGVRFLLVVIGVLLIIEAATPWTSSGLPLGSVAQGAMAFIAGLLIGAVSTLLGVAGGEMIIPTLVLVFGVPIKAAGTTSLLISIPTMLVGLTRHHARGAYQGVDEVRRVVVPMALGTVVGSALGGFLIAYAPAGAVKVLLGVVLIASALRVFKVRA